MVNRVEEKVQLFTTQYEATVLEGQQYGYLISSAVAGLKLLGGAHHERQSHEVLGSPGECSSGKFLYRGSLK